MGIFYHLWKVWLWFNHSNMKSEKEYSAEISTTKFVKNNQDIAERLADEIDVSYNTLIYVINQYDRTVRDLLCEGFTVKTDNLIVTPAIKGEWNEQQLEFQPEKHKRIISCSPTAEMLQALEGVNVKVMGTKDTFARITHVIDQKSGEIDMTLSRNGEIIIKGKSIKAMAEDGSINNCIYLIRPDKTMIDIGGDNLLRNESEEIVLCLPRGIEKGRYNLVIHTCFTDETHTRLKQLRCIEFDKILCVK